MVADVPLPADPPRVADVPQPAAPLKEADVPKPADHPKDFTPPKPVDNLRVTRAAFDKIEWQMSRQDIESILGEGEPVDNILVIRAMGSKLDDKREPYKRVEQGLWMKWKGDDQTNIFVQFGGPNLVQNPDGSYSVGPSTECALVLFITEKPHKGQMNVETRDIRIYWRLGTGYGEIHDLAS